MDFSVFGLTKRNLVGWPKGSTLVPSDHLSPEDLEIHLSEKWLSQRDTQQIFTCRSLYSYNIDLTALRDIEFLVSFS